MTKQIINLGQTANDRTGDPLRVAFEKVNENFDELYARTGDDIQIPALAGNNKKVLTTNGTTLSWGSTIANTGFDNNTVYNFSGIVIDNSDLEHGATALMSIPDNGEAVNPLLLQNNYGSAAVTVGTSPGNLKTWTFGTDGSLTLPGAFTYPNGALQQDTGAINCQGNASTVVFTATGVSVHTIRLLIQVEGVEGIGSSMDTQACEMIVAKSFRADDIAASVYGIVYTSQAPLATFTALWNALTSRIEVLCATPGANNVNVKIFATEITTSD
jgi:hypothetical protein